MALLPAWWKASSGASYLYLLNAWRHIRASRTSSATCRLLSLGLELGRSIMSAGLYGPQQLKDPVIQSRIHHERDQFIAAIDEDDICRLASSHHNGDYCSFFKPPSRGSYNICYFVHFPSNDQHKDAEKWVVRIPLGPCLAHGARSKLESEIVTMQYSQRV